MAKVEVKSVQSGVPSAWVELEHVSDQEYKALTAHIGCLVRQEPQISDAVSKAFQQAVSKCPRANPSDLWQHLVYRGFLDLGHSDQRWKRISGFALERALAGIYAPRLAPSGIRMRILGSPEARKILISFGLERAVKVSKIDMFLEGKLGDSWVVFGAAHVKSSIAERIQDDVPASNAFMKKGLVSVILTMDSKSYPPPHGEGINYGELGGRSFQVDKERMKRDYVEKDGQFDGLFSFNLRTPPSQASTPSGNRIHTLSLAERQPDALVTFLAQRWAKYKRSLPQRQ